MRDIIVYIGSIFLPDKSAGAQRALSLSKSFRDIGYQVVIVGMEEGLASSVDILQTKRECQGFDTYAVPAPHHLSDWVCHSFSIKSFIKILQAYGLQRIHSVVAMEYEAFALSKLSVFCKRHGIHLIADAEEWYDRSSLPFPLNLGKDIDTHHRMYHVYPKKIRHMICISRFLKEYYSDKVANTVCIPGTVDLSEEKWKRLPVYRPNEVLTLAYAGFPGPNFEKERVDWLIEAVCECRQEGHSVRLKIAGFSQERLTSRHPELASMPGYEGAVEYVGKLTHQECLDMVASSDFSVIVRDDKRVTRAGFPTKFSESFACGTPVISTPSSNIADYLENGVNGFLCDGFSQAAVKKAIIEAVSLEKTSLERMHASLGSHPPLRYQDFNEPLKEFMKKVDKTNGVV